MLNRLYVNIKKFIKENYKELLVYIFVFLLLTIRLPYFIYIGGGIINLDKRIELDSNEKGSYNLAYVRQMKATLPTYLLSYIIKSWDLESTSDYKLDENEDMKDIDYREKMFLEEANTNAIINAYTLANKKINIKSNSYKVIYISKDSDTDIKIGDKLISINNKKINNNIELKEYLKTLTVNEKLDIKVLRDDKEINCYAKLIELNNEKIIGLYLVNIKDYEVDPKINLKFKWYESGPSGGFMLSLAIYDRLVSEDLTKGRKIVGTGTIDELGNVGVIGGVKYKLMGAVKNKADIFFVPDGNYEEAIKTKNNFNYKIDIVKVKTIKDAIDYLTNN